MSKSSAIPLPNSPDLSASVRLAQSDAEIKEAQQIRYDVFYEEQGATPTAEMESQRRDFDEFDDITDHLIVVTQDKQTGKEQIVGTYRLLRQETAEKHGRFYSDDEYDLSALLSSDKYLLELGRSCVLPEFRTKPILNLLWQGIASYITDHNIDLLFGCASFNGTNVDAIKEQLSYLHHFHRTPENVNPRALEHRAIDMNIMAKEEIDEKRVFTSLPPLIKGYLRLGATIGEGAVIDEQFNTIDICIVVQTDLLTERYRKHYERRLQKTMPGQKT